MSEKQKTTAKNKKRPVLLNISNFRNGLRNFVHSSRPSTLIPRSRKNLKRKESSTGKLPFDLAPRKSDDALLADADPAFGGNNLPAEKFAISPAPAHVSCHTDPKSIISENGKVDASTSESDRSLGSLTETMSTYDFSSPGYEFLCYSSPDSFDSVHGVRDGPIDAEGTNKDSDDPQFCSALAFEIYENLRSSEERKRPSMDFMEEVQNDIDASMRAILIDWLAEVAEDYKLVPETLFLTVNYIDRYLSHNSIDRKRLQLLGVVCMMIAAKYEEIKAPDVHEFCYITDNTYCREEALQMESIVLKCLKFEMSVPTTKGFLRHFVRVAQQNQEAQLLKFECLANYLAELSLLDYTMLRYPSSMVAASVVFLAKFILSPRKRPWDYNLKNYTLYQASDLSHCVKTLHSLRRNINGYNFQAISEKYNQHKYKFVAKLYCPASIHQDFFEDLCS